MQTKKIPTLRHAAGRKSSVYPKNVMTKDKYSREWCERNGVDYETLKEKKKKD